MKWRECGESTVRVNKRVSECRARLTVKPSVAILMADGGCCRRLIVLPVWVDGCSAFVCVFTFP